MRKMMPQPVRWLTTGKIYSVADKLRLCAAAAARRLAHPELSQMPQQFRGVFQIAGTIGVKERVESRPLFGEIDDFQAIARGPDVDLADLLGDDRRAQRFAQPPRPQPDDRVRPPARRGAGEVGATC